MAYCLTAPSSYLNQCWFLISEVLWHSPESNFTSTLAPKLLFSWWFRKLYILKIIATSPGDQWVNQNIHNNQMTYCFFISSKSGFFALLGCIQIMLQIRCCYTDWSLDCACNRWDDAYLHHWYITKSTEWQAPQLSRVVIYQWFSGNQIAYALEVFLALTHCGLGDFNEILGKYLSSQVSDWWLRYLLWNHPQKNVTRPYWW